MRGGLIVDDNGDPVFFHPTKPKTMMDFRPGRLRGKPVLSLVGRADTCSASARSATT